MIKKYNNNNSNNNNTEMYPECVIVSWDELLMTQRIGQSHDFWRAYSLFVAWVASFVP